MVILLNLTSQKFFMKFKKLLNLEFLKFALQLYGFFYSGPFGHFLHKVMDKIFKGKTGKKTVGKKVGNLQLSFLCCCPFGWTRSPYLEQCYQG